MSGAARCLCTSSLPWYVDIMFIKISGTPIQATSWTVYDRETTNSHDPYAVAVFKSGFAVGHVPRKISALCSLFIRRGGIISCQVNGSRRHSWDLPQGGMKFPCTLTFIADEQFLIDKIINLISEVVNVIPKKKEDDSLPLKVRKLDPGGQVLSDDWVRLDACRVLTMSEREIIV